MHEETSFKEPEKTRAAVCGLHCEACSLFIATKEDPKRIREVGYAEWMTEKREHYACPQCKTLNSAYDLKCRKCGAEPSCAFTAKHREIIEEAMR